VLPDGIFSKPKIPIWVNFEGIAMEDVCNFMSVLSILMPNGTFYAHSVHFLVTYFPVLVCCIEKNLATLQ
jgi:hypothetical protein